MGAVCGFSKERERFKNKKEKRKRQDSNVTDRQLHRAGENICLAAREKHEISQPGDFTPAGEI